MFEAQLNLSESTRIYSGMWRTVAKFIVLYRGIKATYHRVVVPARQPM